MYAVFPVRGGRVHKILQHVLLLQRRDQTAGALAVGELGILEDIIGTAGVNLHIFIRLGPDHLGNGVKDFRHDLAVAAGLLLDIGDQPEVDLGEGQSVEPRIQKQIQLQDLFLADFFIQVDDVVLDDIAFNHDHIQKLSRVQLRQLDELDLISLVGGSRKHRGVVRVVRQKLHHLLENLLHPVRLCDHQAVHRGDLFCSLTHQPVHIQSVRPVCRNSARGCMRLDNVSHLFQIRHLVPDRRGTQVQIRIFGNGSRTYRLTRLEVGLNDRIQYGYFSRIQFQNAFPFLLLALCSMEC